MQVQGQRLSVGRPSLCEHLFLLQYNRNRSLGALVLAQRVDARDVVVGWRATPAVSGVNMACPAFAGASSLAASWRDTPTSLVLFTLVHLWLYPIFPATVSLTQQYGS